MSDFIQLLQLLEKELKQQEKLLTLLSEERAAIVKLNREKIESLNDKKGRLLQEGVELETKRKGVIEELVGTRSKKDPFKLSEIVEHCSSKDIREKLERVGAELRKTALAVQEMNNRNAELIHQSLGVINATISIILSAPQDALPTYSEKGALSSEAKSQRSGRVLKQA